MKDRLRWCIPICIVFAAAAVLAGCGYRFAGGGEFPYGVKKIAVEVLANRTAEAGLENTITNELIYEFNRNGQVQVVEPEKADAVLKGSIEKLSVLSVSRSSILTSQAERVYVLVNLKLVRPDGAFLWKGDGIAEDEAYTVSSDKQVTEANRRRAIKNLSPRLAQKVYNRITANF